MNKNTLAQYTQRSWIDFIGFQDKQKEAIQIALQKKHILYGGAAGGGKSFWLRWSLIYFLIRIYKKYGFKGVQAGLFCEDYVTLNDRQLSKIGTEFPEWLGTFKNDCFTLSEEFGGGKILFRNLDDTSKYRSSEFALVAVDELTMNHQNIFEDLRFRLRWVDNETKQELPYIECKFLGATNPTGRGMGWVKKLWINRNFREYSDGMPEKDFKEFVDSFAFIPALFSDNKYMQHYEKTLSSLEEKMRKALRDGSWDTFEGQFFSEFDKGVHTVNPYSLYFDRNCFISLDYGYSAPSCALFNHVDYDDKITVYKEIYETGFTPSALATAIFNATSPREREAIQYIVADPAIWSKTGEKNGIPISNAEIMMDTFNKLGWAIGMIKADNDRVTGWSIVREYLNSKPLKIAIFNNCPSLIRTFPDLVYAKNRQDDLDTSGEDHSADALRYGLMSRPNGKNNKQDRRDDSHEALTLKIPTAQEVKDSIIALDDYHFNDTIMDDNSYNNDYV